MGIMELFNKKKIDKTTTNKEICFEDEFTDIQSGLISLCLELTDSQVDTVFAYCGIEDHSFMFNSFFEKDGKILSARQAATDVSLVKEFLRVGTHDLENFKSVCTKWNKPIPRQIKMIYDVKTGKFDANISYESRIPYELEGGNVFKEWFDKKLSERTQ